MIVVDNNIICYFWLQHDYSELAQQAMKKDSRWLVPPLWSSEFLNVLAGYT